MSDIIINLQEFTGSLHPLLRWVGVMLAALIPYIEAEGAAIIGVVAGLHPAVAVPFAVLGNAIALIGVIWVTSAVRGGVTRKRDRAAVAAGAAPGSSTMEAAPGGASAPDAKRARMRRVFDRYGVPGVSLLGPLLLPSHVTAAAMVGFGASRVKVFVWGVVAVAAWATLFTVLVHFGIQAAIG